MLESEAGSKQYEMLYLPISLLVNAGHVDVLFESVYTSHWEFFYCKSCLVVCVSIKTDISLDTAFPFYSRGISAGAGALGETIQEPKRI